MEAVRAHFPGLARVENGRQVVFLDGPAGSQLPVECSAAITRYLETANANHGGAFGTSRETDELVAEARTAAAAFLGAHDADEVVFGANMTTLTFAVSRALARDMRPGDEIILSRLDHDANIAPWLAVAEERGLRVRWLDVRPEDCTLDLDALADLVGARTRIVAVGLASNAVGTLNDVGRVIELAHAYRALVYVDAVHAAPHIPLDVAALRADVLVCSPYKFYAPHLGLLYGRQEVLERIAAYHVRPAGDRAPETFETGTQPFELLAGMLGTFDYLATLGRAYGNPRGDDRRAALTAAMATIRSHERALMGPLVEGLGAIRGLRLYGISRPARFDQRVPTFAFTIDGFHPRRIAEHLASRAINAWDGDMYALELIRALGLDDAGGVVRIGLMHYTTHDEVQRLLVALAELVDGGAAGDNPN